jgi:hypothetical protein
VGGLRERQGPCSSRLRVEGLFVGVVGVLRILTLKKEDPWPASEPFTRGFRHDQPGLNGGQLLLQDTSFETRGDLEARTRPSPRPRPPGSSHASSKLVMIARCTQASSSSLQLVAFASSDHEHHERRLYSDYAKILYTEILYTINIRCSCTDSCHVSDVRKQHQSHDDHLVLHPLSIKVTPKYEPGGLKPKARFLHNESEGCRYIGRTPVMRVG